MTQTERLILENQMVLRAPEIGQTVEHYFTVKEIVGTPTKKGAKSLQAIRLNIELDEVEYKVYTTKEQDQELEIYYRKAPVILTVKQKRSLKDDRIISAELLKITPIPIQTIAQGLDKLKGLDLNFLD